MSEHAGHHHHAGRHLRRGSTGRAVSFVQSELKRQLVPELKLDGDFGPATEEAVRFFQQSVGFAGSDIDGEMKSRTTLALSQTFHFKMRGRVGFDLKPLTLRPITSSAAPPVFTPVEEPNPKSAKAFFGGLSANMQLGMQKSWRDGIGYQISLGGTLKSRKLFPDANENKVYNEAHGELLPAFNLGLPFPNPGRGVVTGQFSLTLQPITDWLVISQAQLQFLNQSKVHLFTPNIAFNYQHPLGSYPGRSDDPATRQRIGGAFGFELAHVDLPYGLSVGVSGAEAFYWDSKGGKLHWDPSVMGFAQWSYDIIK